MRVRMVLDVNHYGDLMKILTDISNYGDLMVIIMI
mgnify:FL=1